MGAPFVYSRAKPEHRALSIAQAGIDAEKAKVLGDLTSELRNALRAGAPNEV